MRISQLALRAPFATALTFDVEENSKNRSGFSPAIYDSGGVLPMFGDARLAGFAAALRTGFTEHLLIVGGNESRIKNCVVNRAWAIREMLIHDFSIDPNMVSAIPSNSNTGGGVAIIVRKLRELGVVIAESGLITSLYHLPRTSLDLAANSLPIPLYPAEAFILVAGGKENEASNKNDLIRTFGGGPLAERCVAEIQGIADKIRGTYQPRTDTPANTFFHPTRSLSV